MELSSVDLSEKNRDMILHILRRLFVVLLILVVATTVMFMALYLGPKNPANKDRIDPENRDKYERLGLLETSLLDQYTDYMTRLFTFDFGEVWNYRNTIPSNGFINDINRLIPDRLYQTAWMWFWTLIIGFGVGIPLGIFLGLRRGSSKESRSIPGKIGGMAVYSLPLFFLGSLLIQWLKISGDFLFGFKWETFFAKTPIKGPTNLGNLFDPHFFIVATKQIFPASLVLAVPLIGVLVRIGYKATSHSSNSDYAEFSEVSGKTSTWEKTKTILPNVGLSFAVALPWLTNILIGGTIIVETVFEREGIGHLFVEANRYNDFTTLQAVVFIFLIMMAASILLRDVLYTLIAGPPSRSRGSWYRKAMSVWTAAKDRTPGMWKWARSDPDSGDRNDGKLSLLIPKGTAGDGVISRVKSNPRPAAVWVSGILFLFALEFGAVASAFFEVAPFNVGFFDNFKEFPTLLSRELIPNDGYRTAAGVWKETFLGLQPKYAWAIRVALVFVYAFTWLVWLWYGYSIYTSEYRRKDTTPFDRLLNRLRRDRWVTLGFFIVFTFVVMAVFAPTLGPTDIDHAGMYDENETFKYLHGQGDVREITIRKANHNSRSWPPSIFANLSSPWGNTSPSFDEVTSTTKYGLMSYDKFGRFHPAGTTPEGQDLFTDVILEGAQIYLLIGTVTVVLASLIALFLSLLTSYYRSIVDSFTEVFSDFVLIFPLLPLALIVYHSLGMGYIGQTPKIPDMYNNSLMFGIFLSVPLGLVMWRTVRGPVYDVMDSEWFDEARHQGIRKLSLIKKVSRHVSGYLFAYGMMGFGAAILTTAALSRVENSTLLTRPMGWASYSTGIQFGAANAGGIFATSFDWHVALVPGLALLIVVAGFVMLADGIRDAVDKEREMGNSVLGDAFTRGGGG